MAKAAISTPENIPADTINKVPAGIVRIPVNFTPTPGTVQARPVTVNFITIPDTAVETGNRDYFGKSGSLTFQPNASGMPSQLFIPIEIVNDGVFEGNETFSVSLSVTSTSGATLGTPSVTRVTIVDDDPIPVVSVSPAAPVSEGSGVKNFVVSVKNRSQTPITVNYAFVDGTATKPADYNGTDGTLTFAPGGPVSAFVQATIVDDQIAEGNETFSLVLSKDPADTKFTLPTATATSTVIIVDNDRTPEFRISDASVIEGDTGTQATGAELVFPITLTRASSRPVTFNYSLLNLRQPNCTPAFGCDVASDADYAVVRNVTGTIPAGATTGEVRVRITPDTLNEYNEQFALVSRGLTNAVPAVYKDPTNGTQRFGTTAFGTITNDDPGGNITISGPTDPQGNAITTIAEGYNRGAARPCWRSRLLHGQIALSSRSHRHGQLWLRRWRRRCFGR